MTDFERIEQTIEEHERELQKLESEIQQKRKKLEDQRQALALLRPLLISVLGAATKGVILEPDSVRNESNGVSFRYGKKI
jgi:chromosome segregation ATPase